jgi:hypothetical protein
MRCDRYDRWASPPGFGTSFGASVHESANMPAVLGTARPIDAI